jgi:hypothetical protein
MRPHPPPCLPKCKSNNVAKGTPKSVRSFQRWFVWRPPKGTIATNDRSICNPIASASFGRMTSSDAPSPRTTKRAKYSSGYARTASPEQGGIGGRRRSECSFSNESTSVRKPQSAVEPSRRKKHHLVPATEEPDHHMTHDRQQERGSRLSPHPTSNGWCGKRFRRTYHLPTR